MKSRILVGVWRSSPVFGLMLSLVLAVASRPALAGNPPGAERPHRAAEAKADALVEPAMRESGVGGVALAVIRGGDVVVKKGYGARSLDDPLPPDENTLFNIQSLSKGITGVGVLALVDDGKLKLDAPLGTYLPNLPKAWRGVTLRQAAAHQSGIPQLPKKLPSFEEMLTSARDLPLSFRPGSKQDYNNFNFAILGQVISAVTGQSYVEAMKARVFRPLHMDHTGAGIEAPNRAIPWKETPNAKKPVEHHLKADYGIASGHLETTLSDLLKLHTALDGGAFLKPSSQRALETRVTPSFPGTVGWFERQATRRSIVSKNGAGQGFHSFFTYVPGTGHAVIILWTTFKPGPSPLNAISGKLLEEICGVRGAAGEAGDFTDED